MFRVIMSHHRNFFEYLIDKKIPSQGSEFSFLHLEHFLNLASNFISNYIIDYEIRKLVRDGLISEEEIDEFHKVFDGQFREEIEFCVLNTLSSDDVDKTYFSIDHFISCYLADIQKQIRNVLFESLTYPNSTEHDISPVKEKVDVLYMVIEPNGSITLEKKDCTFISNHSYHQQEESVAEVLFLNPSLLIVYDSLHLLKHEMAICLKKMLRKKVIFLEEDHPLREDRKA